MRSAFMNFEVGYTRLEWSSAHLYTTSSGLSNSTVRSLPLIATVAARPRLVRSRSPSTASLIRLSEVAILRQCWRRCDFLCNKLDHVLGKYGLSIQRRADNSWTKVCAIQHSHLLVKPDVSRLSQCTWGQGVAFRLTVQFIAEPFFESCHS